MNRFCAGVLVPCLAVALMCFASGLALAQENEPAIGEIIEGVIDAQKLVGTQAAVWHGGEMIFEQSWGQADLAQDVPVTSDTRFLIASITKSITGLAVLQLAEEGRIDLDASITEYVPEFTAAAGEDVTVRMLLTHRSGVRGYNPGETTSGAFLFTHYPMALDAIEIFKDDPLLFTPGARESYTSFGYALLAAAVEEISDQPFGDSLREHIFEPAGMHATEAPDWRYPVENLAPSYGYYLPHLGAAPGPAQDAGPLRARRLHFSYNPGGGNLVSTARDLLAYGRQYLGGGLVGPSIVAQMRTPPDGSQQGYGWWIDSDDAGRPVMHATGASEAYQAGMTIWPDHDLIVVALSNTWGVNSRAGGFTLTMHKAIAELLLDPEAD